MPQPSGTTVRGNSLPSDGWTNEPAMKGFVRAVTVIAPVDVSTAE